MKKKVARIDKAVLGGNGEGGGIHHPSGMGGGLGHWISSLPVEVLKERGINKRGDRTRDCCNGKG